VTDGVLIDGSQGEGGGQILRTSLTLSMVTGRPFRMVRIRSNRPKPGLAAQHLACVKAAAVVSSARVGGAEIGSQDLHFVPGPVKPSDFAIEIGTAGSTSLVLQTVAIPLCMADGESRVRLTGGTHVPWSPLFPFLETDWAPAMAKFGLPLSVKLVKPGYFPVGRGEILALIPGRGQPKPLVRRVRGNLRTVQGQVFYSRFPRNLAERVARDSRRQLRRAGVAVNVDPENLRGPGQALGIHLAAVMQDETRVGFSFLSERGRSPDKISRRSANFLFQWLDSGMTVPGHLADQILLPLSLAREPTHYTTSRVTRHLLTNAEVIRRFRPVTIRIDGREGQPGDVRIEPA
jgi:RNA 3'-terminal phosphate cyclase (ATP)